MVKKHIVLIQRTQAQFPGPTPGGSQSPATPEDLTASSGIHRHTQVT